MKSRKMTYLTVDLQTPVVKIYLATNFPNAIVILKTDRCIIGFHPGPDIVRVPEIFGRSRVQS